MKQKYRLKLDLQTFAGDDFDLGLLEDVLSSEELLVYAQKLEVPNAYLHPLLFPAEQTDELTVDVIMAQNRLPVMAQIAHLGTETKYGSREGMKGQTVEIPKIQRGRWMDEKLIRIMLLATRGGGLRREEVARIVREQLNDAAYCVDAIRARKEWIAMQAVTIGKVEYTEGDVRVNVNWGYTTEQTPVLTGTDKWSDVVNSRPIEDIQNWWNYQADRGVRLTRAFTSRRVVSYLLQNLSIRRQYFGNPSGTAEPPQLNRQQLNAVLDGLGLPRIIEYDTQARIEHDELENGHLKFSTVRMTPEDRFVMIPDGALGNYLWATTTEQLLSGIETEQTADAGIYVFRDLTSKHPLRLRTVGVNLAFPVFPYADTVMSATVI
jgi:hypothetical protein